ncbi:MAG: SUMF1/EgtB/PvdO family nonheme iron enzyme, partial [Kiritimatiellae bacterium]|nr:SUMF1/EgtB/PvdO family nonheme iron enzyme [Kiritimatiellia bacterium]
MFRMMMGYVFAVIATVTAGSVLADYVDANNTEYESLDYIKASGNQWIVTDIVPSCTDTVKMKFRLTTAGTQALYCSRTAMTENTFTAFHIENVVRCDRNTNNSAKGTTQPGIGSDTILVADYDTRRFSVNGIDQNVVLGEGNFTPGSKLMLFASHTKGSNLSAGIASTDVGNKGSYRLYYFELYASGSETPKHCLMPVRRKTDAVAGLYDTVEGKFYSRATNSGEFTAGPFPPSISNVTAVQRYPWNGKVDISYTVTGDVDVPLYQNGLIAPSLKVTAIDMVANTTNIAATLSGDTNLTAGTHHIVWDMNADGLNFKSSNVVFDVSFEATPSLYCVIDLSAGSSATSYPVTYLAEPPSGGFNVDEYKTTKLVLKRIEVGSYIMGTNQTDETHRVTLTKPFYIGVFEVTQKQYQLIMGSNPSSFSGDKRPVEKVSYNMIRGASAGAQWPSSSAVDSSSFLGKLRARTGLEFDLPTEAQWEYACRAGTMTTYSYGNGADGNYMWYKPNSSSQTHDVGLKNPNVWGLYDMHGNVWEWCLDWYGTLSYGTNPKGVPSGTLRNFRGGCWFHNADQCTSSYCGRDNPTVEANDLGFRLCRTIYPNACTVTFNANGGDGEMAPQSLVPGQDPISPCSFTRNDYAFTGWATNANGGVVYQDLENAELSGDVTLYAVWESTVYSESAVYSVIDLSAGPSAASYPVIYLAEPPEGGFNADAYKTTKLVLRRIEAGSYIMGTNQTDESHRVTLTKPFYIGVFEVTQKQYQLVMGSNPSNFSGDKRPVEKVSYNMIRGASAGAQWP